MGQVRSCSCQHPGGRSAGLNPRAGGGAVLLWIAVFFFALVPQPAKAALEFELKLATLAPENSSLARVFDEMNAELVRETGGKVGFKLFAGAIMGDEEDVLRKLRAGVIHGAVFTSSALTDINPDLRAFLIPFMFSDTGEVDYVLERMDPSLRRKFDDRGYVVLGWPEMGFLYFMSSTPVAGLEDLKGKRVWAKANAPMSQALIDRVGVSTVAIGVPDVLMGLQTRLVDVVYNSPYYALATQWNTQVKYLTDLPLTYIGGALILDKKAFGRIPAPLQVKVRDICGSHIARLVERTRQDNAEAMELIFKRGVGRVTPSPEQAQAFKDLSDAAMKDLDPKLLPAEATAAVRKLLAEHRSSPKNRP
ncbi:MAG: TRAP transporter substrate-binding protein DctP [Syntrophobacteraceae bacterium]|jgi:TRAP-type C4-dicarboxylate transport system substrate-binding protein|nr:TRAP transporter substrate-binding protein DctP [Syntrophobacteraceae bacterium]